MTAKTLIHIPLVIVLCAGIANAQSADPMEELKACARIADADARAECYDTLGQRALDEESANSAAISEPDAATAAVSTAVVAATPDPEPEPAAATVATAAAAATSESGSAEALPDDIGGQRFEEEKDTDTKYADRVVSCSRNVDGKWVFTFESGQVWKQVSSRKVVLDDDACQFGATVNKDFFGYKMQIEGEKGKIRISRLK